MVITELSYQVILSSTDLKNKREGGGAVGVTPLGFPHHDPFCFTEKELLEKGRKDEKLEFVSCAFCTPSRSSYARGDFGDGGGRHRCKYPSGNNKNSFKWATSPSSMY